MRRSMKPCITTWPAYVPTLELDRPEASSATANASAAPPPISASMPGVRALDRVDARAPGVVEQLGRDDEHRQVDDPGDAHRDQHVDALEAQQLALLVGALGRDPRRWSAPSAGRRRAASPSRRGCRRRAGRCRCPSKPGISPAAKLAGVDADVNVRS